jgi:hypothetical protein
MSVNCSRAVLAELSARRRENPKSALQPLNRDCTNYNFILLKDFFKRLAVHPPLPLIEVLRHHFINDDVVVDGFAAGAAGMIPKSGSRFSEKIMPKQEPAYAAAALPCGSTSAV